MQRMGIMLKKENIKNDLSVRFGPRFDTSVFPLGPEIVRAPGVAGTCLSASLKTKLFCETSPFFEPDNVKNEAILRDFLNVWKLTTSKMKQYCETSFKNGTLSAELTASYQRVFRVFPLHVCKVLRLPRKSEARSYQVQHLSRRIILANPKIWCSKMQPFSGNQRPGLLTPLMISDEHVSCTAPAKRSAFLQIFFKCTTHANAFETATKPSRFHSFGKVQNPLRLPRKNDIWTSKSAPNPSVFHTCDFEMCFAPQRRALFRHLNFQKCSETVSF